MRSALSSFNTRGVDRIAPASTPGYFGVGSKQLKASRVHAPRAGVVESKDGLPVETGALGCGHQMEGRVSADHRFPFSGVSTQLERASNRSNGETLEREPDLGTPQFSGGRLWMHRLAVLLFVFFCAILGVILIIFPWRDEWTTNSFLIGDSRL